MNSRALPVQLGAQLKFRPKEAAPWMVMALDDNVLFAFYPRDPVHVARNKPLCGRTHNFRSEAVVTRPVNN